MSLSSTGDREEENAGLIRQGREEEAQTKFTWRNSCNPQMDLRATKGMSPREMPKSFSSRFDRRLSSETVSR